MRLCVFSSVMWMVDAGVDDCDDDEDDENVGDDSD